MRLLDKSNETCSMENGDHLGLGFTWIDTFFAKLCAKKDYHISAPVIDLDRWLFDLNSALAVTYGVGNLSSKFERCSL